MKKSIIIATGCAAVVASCGTYEAPKPYGPVPTAQQLEWQKMEMNMFCHFGPNTFTSAEWGSGQESVNEFNPSDLDCRQWTSIAKAAGMKGIIITAKHHDGFCLWPNPASRHTVAQSAWMDGKGDVLKELSQACSESGIKFGVYISPWDRNDPAYGTDKYNDVYCRTLESALGNYGPVFEHWFDGACGEGPNGKIQKYDWPLFHKTVRDLQPDAVMFSDIGPGCRWVGNEKGYAGETCWSTLDTAGFTPGKGAPVKDTLACAYVTDNGHKVCRASAFYVHGALFVLLLSDKPRALHLFKVVVHSRGGFYAAFRRHLPDGGGIAVFGGVLTKVSVYLFYFFVAFFHIFIILQKNQKINAFTNFCSINLSNYLKVLQNIVL